MNPTTLTKTNSNQNMGTLYMALELSKKTWKLAFSDGGQRRPRVVSVSARDLEALKLEVTKAKKKFGLASEAAVRSCYEAGRDGFWIHRALTAIGIESLVVDPASIEVNRRTRQAKTDRLDAIKLVMQLVRHWRNEERVWSVVRVPSPRDEDDRQLHRDLDQLKSERGAHKQRIQSLLFAQGVDLKVSGKLADTLDRLQIWDGTELPTELKERINRELARLALVEAQISEIEKKQKQAVKKAETEKLEKVQLMMQLRGVGMVSAWILVMEMFGWRKFKNRREVGGSVGLTGTPFDSGKSEREQGISKTGSKRVRSLLVELSWLWLRYQPESKLSRWFNERFGSGGKRIRKVGIVAVARRLVIALWRFVEQGVVPDGAQLES